MSKLTDKSIYEASVNPDGKTYDGRKVLRWLHEALTGKPMLEDEAEKLIEMAQKIAEERRVK